MRTLARTLIFSSLLAALPLQISAQQILCGHDELTARMDAIMARTDNPTPAHYEGIRLFSWLLQEHGRHLMGHDEYHEAEAAHSFLSQADDLDGRSATPDNRARANRFRAAGEQSLLALLAEIAWPVRVSLSAEGIPAWDNMRVLSLPGTSGTLLIRIDDHQSAGTVFRTMPQDFDAINVAHLAEPDAPTTVTYAPGKTTWQLIRIKETPTDFLVLPLMLKADDGSRSHLMYLRLQPGSMGELSFTLLDENAQPAPAMMRLTHTATGALYPPGAQVDYTDQMDYISGNPSPSPSRSDPGVARPYPHSIPGKFGGHYFVNGGPFSMALPAGEWELHLWRGPEYRPVHMTFTVSPHRKTELSMQLDRWIDMSARGWFSGDTHVHSRIMSDADAERLLVWLEAADLHVANVVKMGNNARTYFEQRGFGPKYRVQRGNRVLVPGQEDPRYVSGHSLAINIASQVRQPDRYMYNDWVSDQARVGGGLYGHAHLTFNTFDIRRDMTMLMPMGKSDFGEIMQIGVLDTDLYYEFLNMGFKLTAASGSDVPYGHGLAEGRYYVYTGGKTLNTDDFFAAMAAGRTFVSNGPMLDFTINGQLPGSTITVAGGEKLRIKAQGESLPSEEGYLQSLQLFHLGDMIHEMKNSDPTRQTLSFELELDAAYGGWYALKANNRDGTKAHTTAIYVQREGFRHWKHDEFPESVARARAKLEEMELELLDFVQREQSGEFDPAVYFGQQIVGMVPEMISKIQHVRSLYDGLETIHRSESNLRSDQSEVAP